MKQPARSEEVEHDVVKLNNTSCWLSVHDEDNDDDNDGDDDGDDDVVKLEISITPAAGFQAQTDHPPTRSTLGKNDPNSPIDRNFAVEKATDVKWFSSIPMQHAAAQIAELRWRM